MKSKKLFCFTTVVASAMMSSLFAVDSVTWQEFNNNQMNIPDFSYSGYHYSEEAPPTLSPSTNTYFNVMDYGAVPNDGLSDYDAIQNAINAAQQAAQTGSSHKVVFFPAGRFRIREEADKTKGPLRISSNYIVLKGTGAYSTGTELFANALTGGEIGQTKPAILFEPTFVQRSNWRGDTITNVVRPPLNYTYDKFPMQNYVEISNSNLSKVSGFQSGDIIYVSGQYSGWQPHKVEYFAPRDPFGKERYYVHEMHEVDQLIGNKLYFKTPIHANPSDVYALYLNSNIKEVGMEDIAVTGNFRGNFLHYWSSQSDGHVLVKTNMVSDAWFRNMRFSYGTFGLDSTRTAKSSVINATNEGNWGHLLLRFGYSSTNNLIANFREYSRSHHGLGSTDYAPGMVNWRCYQQGNLEFHGNAHYNVLADLNSGEFGRSRVGGASPFIGRGLVYWNWKNIDDSGKKIHFKDMVFPAVVGLQNPGNSINDVSFLGINEFSGQEVQPESLFQAQLAKRLGTTPSWLTALISNFENISRYSYGTLTAPKIYTDYNQSDDITFTFNPYSLMNVANITKIDFFASPVDDLDDPFQRILLGTATASPYSIVNSTLEPGAWVIRARMTNSLGQEFTTKMTNIRVNSPEQVEVKLNVADAIYVQDYDGYKPFENAWNANKSNHTAFVQAITDIVNNNSAYRTDATKITDSNINTSMYNYRGMIMHFKFDNEKDLDKIVFKIKNSWDASNKPTVSVAVSNDAGAFYDVRNRMGKWTYVTQKLFPSTSMPEYSTTSNGAYILPISFPRVTARYARIVLYGGRNTAVDADFFNIKLEPTTTINVSDDAYIRGGSNASNTYNGGDMIVRNAGYNSSYDRRAIVKIDLSQINDINNYTAVILKVRMANYASATDTISAYLLDNDSWTENTVTYSDIPEVTTSPVASVSNLAPYKWVGLDITNIVKSQLASGDQTLSLLLKSPNGSGYNKISTTESSSKPVVELY